MSIIWRAICAKNTLAIFREKWADFMTADALVPCVISPDSQVHGANMGPTWVLSAPGGPPVGPMNLAIREVINNHGTDNER